MRRAAEPRALAARRFAGRPTARARRPAAGRILFGALGAAFIMLAASCSPAAEPESVYANIGPVEVLGHGLTFVEAGGGVVNLNDKADMRSTAGRIEVRIGRKLAFAGPALGLLLNDGGFRYGYAGLYADLVWGRFVVIPVLAAGLYRKGHNFDLGGCFEFRESVQVAYKLDARWRAGLSIAHISNARIYRQNPGQKDVFLTIAAGF